MLPNSGDSQADEWIRLGIEAQLAAKFPDADRYYRRALRLEPCNAIATHNLGIVMAQTGNLNEGLLAMDRAGIFNDTQPVIAANLALMYLEADRIDDAIRAAEIAVSRTKAEPADPMETAGYVAARLASAMIAATAGEPTRSLPFYNEILAKDPKHPAAGPNSCFVQTLIGATPAELLEQRLKWYKANRFEGRKFPCMNDPNPDRVLKVGYVGGDFKSHSAAMMFAQVILNHDPEKVTPYLYCSLPVNAEQDDMTARFQKAVGEHWRDISMLADERAAELVDDDHIDILVDLAGHTNGGRLALFSRKLAPVQVTAWGFAHGTGLAEMDYFFADPVAVPEAERGDYTEKVYDLPCVVTYRPPVEYGIKGNSPMPYFRNDYFTFGSFSRYEKLSDDCLRCFAAILRRVPDSRLFLKDHAFRRPYSIRRVLSYMEGVDKNRILFGISSSHGEHMQTYQQVDLCLDPFPHGGGIVSLETLYVGVPMITRYGTQPAGRTASSVLTTLGRTDWIAKDDADYIDKAVEWSGRTADLKAARKTLQDELVNSPVVNGYAGAVENAYREIWRRWCHR